MNHFVVINYILEWHTARMLNNAQARGGDSGKFSSEPKFAN